MTNFEKVVELMKESMFASTEGNIFCQAIHKIRQEENCAGMEDCEACTEWLKQEYKESPKTILTDKEREYLSAVIEPFRDRIVNIKKTEHDETKYEYIVMRLIFRNCFDDYLEFPLFNKDEYYKNMEIDRQYTLKELGL